jgi:hypothetical protein
LGYVLGLGGVRYIEVWGQLPTARPRLNPRHEAARRRKKELILRDTRTGFVVLAAESTSIRTHKRLQSDDITKIIISV